MNIISLTQEEFTENVDFAFKLASKGHSLKIKTNDNIVLLVTAVASEVNDPENPELNIPSPDEFVPDPVATQAYVTQSLGEMTQGF
jgi:hypothetical protein|tara:strand:- start:603 stop:860 length:258 start_codon:yes stop_codon:yes gene_type:complete